MAGYERTTKDEFWLYVNYGDGWEHELSEETRAEILTRKKEYEKNCPQYPVRWAKKRIPLIEKPVEESTKRYRVVRMYYDGHPKQTVPGQTNLTEAQAQAYCSDPQTHSKECTTEVGKRRTRKYGAWFCGYEEM